MGACQLEIDHVTQQPKETCQRRCRGPYSSNIYCGLLTNCTTYFGKKQLAVNICLNGPLLTKNMYSKTVNINVVVKRLGKMGPKSLYSHLYKQLCLCSYFCHYTYEIIILGNWMRFNKTVSRNHEACPIYTSPPPIYLGRVRKTTKMGLHTVYLYVYHGPCTLEQVKYDE